MKVRIVSDGLACGTFVSVVDEHGVEHGIPAVQSVSWSIHPDGYAVAQITVAADVECDVKAPYALAVASGAIRETADAETAA